MAEVVPFPLAHRVGFVSRQARAMSGLTADAAERYLASQIDQQRSVLLRKGIDPLRAEQELTALSSAVRAALWREIILRPGGGVA